MRNALILLAVVALLILVVGALNNGTAFDIDYAAGTVTSVSLFWVSAVIAALVFVSGVAAAWFAQAAVAGRRRKLEAELQSTYERLREAEALASRPAPAVAVATPTVVSTTVVAEDETVVVAEEQTVVAAADAPEVAGEPVTAGAEPEAVVEAGEQTAVTMTGAAAEADEAAPPVAEDATAAAGPDDESPATGS